MIAFHGTDRTSASNIVGTPSNIDVKRGGGELGRGFYLGENIALAASLSRGKFGTNGVVIKFDIDDSAYVSLNTKVLNRRQYVYRLWQSLITRSRAFQHLFNVDVVCAPFATIDFSYQYKFESQNAQSTLNNNSIKQIL
ncbi:MULTISPECIES: DUF3990 domain-containing protein [unclassified Chryseobacterium]|uniref:DUF3990 domain-containing protein n=1 Tax=unclassified Chryseobacterium TaxID=2593645 RepID=UPI0006FA5F92|nr:MULTISPECIES: DUF3990 domain-containing protein [unclassified Chryseobacterium]KQM23424.1 hypothetical protein ASE55_05465 [Chryseobacterium sp. Leaf201]